MVMTPAESVAAEESVATEKPEPRSPEARADADTHHWWRSV